MKARTLVPTLALAAALIGPPLAEARDRDRAPRGRRPPAHGYYGRPAPRHPGYAHRYRPYYRPHYRPSYRPYYRPYYRYYAPPAYHYGYAPYGYAYPYAPPPPPPRYCPPRPRVGFWFRF